MIKRLTENSVKLCNQNGCCPVIELGADDKFTILDDFNNVVVLSKEQILAVSEAAKQLLE
jgi:hypothetical protein